jgi:uncharacterized membrane protein
MKNNMTPQEQQPQGFWQKIRKYLITGVLVTAPLGITVYITWFIISFFDGLVAKMFPKDYQLSDILPVTIPGLGLIIVIIGLIFVGFFTANYFGRTILRIGHDILESMPIIRGIFGAFKQVFETLFSQDATAFRKVVMVEFPRKGCWALGFITADTKEEIKNIHENEVLSVFIATTPNPTSGFFMFYDKDDVHPLTMTPEDGIKMVISGGIVTPPDRRSDEERKKSIIPSKQK